MRTGPQPRSFATFALTARSRRSGGWDRRSQIPIGPFNRATRRPAFTFAGIGMNAAIAILAVMVAMLVSLWPAAE